jgi:hypothetical protein
MILPLGLNVWRLNDVSPGRPWLNFKEQKKMIFDILVALVITVIAVVLGITVHPVLLFIIVLAIVYLVARSRSRSRL